MFASDAITFEGPIVPGDAERFNEAQAAMIKKTGHAAANLLLDSPGGDVLESFKIADAARSTGHGDQGMPYSMCASACVVILASGVVVLIPDHARVGVQCAYESGRGKVLMESSYLIASRPMASAT